jgi:hypothetical protein
MASAKAVSTNVAHYKALTLTAQLAREAGDTARAARYERWAGDLKTAINARLWLKDAGMYSSLTAAHFDGAAMHKFDWLGQALAIVTGVADPAQARSILAHYPHGPMGPPVIWPQQPGMPVYHNRAMWPFVTAYGLKAAAMAGNVAVADAAYESLMRGAALNMSNMENLEWLSGQPLLLDEKNPSLIGPVINSRRQLWSVGAYLGMVIENVFGVNALDEGIALRPSSRRSCGARPSRHRPGDAAQPAPARAAALRAPAAAARQQRARLPQGRARAPQWRARRRHNCVDPAQGWRHHRDPARRAGDGRHGDPPRQRRSIQRVARGLRPARTRHRAPRARCRRPRALHIGSGGNGAGTVYHVYRDGQPVALNQPAGAWLDREPRPNACYAVEAEFARRATAATTARRAAPGR